MSSMPLIRGRRRALTLAVALLLALGAGYSVPTAQTTAKRPLSVDDYTKWRSITGPEISGDGKWVAYTLQITNVIQAESKPVLHIRNLDTSEEVTVADATGGTFSADSKWIAYQVDPGAAQRARAGRGGAGGGGSGRRHDAAGRSGDAPFAPAPPVTVTPGTTPPVTPPGTPPATPPSQPAATAPGQPPQAPATAPGQGPATGGRGAGAPAIPPRRVELRNLATGAVQSWQEIGTFTFSPTSTYLFLRRRAPEGQGGNTGGRGGAPGAPGGGAPAGGGAAAAPPAGPRGLDVDPPRSAERPRSIARQRRRHRIQRTGTLLAYTVDARHQRQ